MRKNINKFILILLVLNAAIIYFVFARSYSKKQNIKIDGDNVVSEINIEYDVQANPLSKITINDLSNTDAKINSCVGGLGQSIDISGNFFNFQLKDATVTMKYNEDKLGDTREESLGVLWYDKENQQMVTMDSKIDTEKNTITFETNHFSEYVIVNLDTWEAAWKERVVRVREDSDTFNIAFVIDDSGSMESNDPDKLRIKATKNFVDILEEKDKFSIVKFEYSATVIQESTNDKKTVDDLESSFQSNGGTDIASGLEKGLELLGKGDNAGRVIVLLTDGEDSTLTSRKEELIKKAIDNNVTIFTIFLNTGKNTNEGDTADIAEIAARTNGNFYTINTDELINIFKRISQVSVGVDGNTDTDGDGIPDEIELGGMRTIFGNIVYTNPYSADTDGDGKSDKEEMGRLIQRDGQDDVYLYSSDPTRKNCSKIRGFTAGVTNSSWSLGSWDSGFKLNRDAFKYSNMRVKANFGVCEGIALITEKIYNQEELPLSVADEVEGYGRFIESREETEKYIKDDENTEIIEENLNGENKKQVLIKYKMPGYNVTDKDLSIIFEKRLPYFYYAKTDELENSSPISSNYLKQNTSDSKLIESFFYYWGAGNLQYNVMQSKVEQNPKTSIKIKETTIVDGKEIATTEKTIVDGKKSVTEQTISKLKVLFSNKKIVTISFGSGYNHTINGYALEQMSETKYRLYVYDNNVPFYKEKNQYIELTKVNDTDRYNVKYDDGNGSGVKIDSSKNTIEDDDFLGIRYNDKLINFTDDRLEI